VSDFSKTGAARGRRIGALATVGAWVGATVLVATLAACGGGGGGDASGTSGSPGAGAGAHPGGSSGTPGGGTPGSGSGSTPLSVKATLQVGVVDMDATGLVPQRVGAESLTYASAPSMLRSGTVFKYKQRAYKVDRIDSASTGAVIVSTVTPTLQEVFSDLEIQGSIDSLDGATFVDPVPTADAGSAQAGGTTRESRAGLTIAPPSCKLLSGEASCSVDVKADAYTAKGRLGARKVSVPKVDISLLKQTANIEAKAEMFGEIDFLLHGGRFDELKDDIPLKTLSYPIPQTLGLVSVTVPLAFTYSVRAGIGLNYKVTFVSPMNLSQTKAGGAAVATGTATPAAEPHTSQSVEWRPASPLVTSAPTNGVAGVALNAEAFLGLKSGVHLAAFGDTVVAGVPLRAGVKGTGYMRFADILGQAPCWALVPEFGVYAQFEMAFKPTAWTYKTAETQVVKRTLPTLESVHKCSPNASTGECSNVTVMAKWYQPSNPFPLAAPATLFLPHWLAYGDHSGMSPSGHLNQILGAAFSRDPNTGKLNQRLPLDLSVPPGKDYRWFELEESSIGLFVSAVSDCMKGEAGLAGFPNMQLVEQCPDAVLAPYVDLSTFSENSFPAAEDWSWNVQYKHLPLRRIVKKMMLTDKTSSAVLSLQTALTGGEGEALLGPIEVTLPLTNALPLNDPDHTFWTLPMKVSGEYIWPTTTSQAQMTREYREALQCHANAARSVLAAQQAKCPACIF
jgi:hypothetical protein